MFYYCTTITLLRKLLLICLPRFYFIIKWTRRQRYVYKVKLNLDIVTNMNHSMQTWKMQKRIYRIFMKSFLAKSMMTRNCTIRGHVVMKLSKTLTLRNK